jgi:hypothetical protein
LQKKAEDVKQIGKEKENKAKILFYFNGREE